MPDRSLYDRPTTSREGPLEDELAKGQLAFASNDSIDPVGGKHLIGHGCGMVAAHHNEGAELFRDPGILESRAGAAGETQDSHQVRPSLLHELMKNLERITIRRSHGNGDLVDILSDKGGETAQFHQIRVRLASS